MQYSEDKVMEAFNLYTRLAARGQLADLGRRSEKCDMELSKLRDRQYYREAMAADLLADDRDYEVLAGSIYSLQLRLNGYNASRRELEGRLQAAEKEVARLQEELLRLRENTDSVLQERPEYPFDGEEQEKLL